MKRRPKHRANLGTRTSIEATNSPRPSLSAQDASAAVTPHALPPTHSLEYGVRWPDGHVTLWRGETARTYADECLATFPDGQLMVRDGPGDTWREAPSY